MPMQGGGVGEEGAIGPFPLSPPPVLGQWGAGSPTSLIKAGGTWQPAFHPLWWLCRTA